MNVGEAMTTQVVTVPPDMPLREVARILVERRISGVPVVDADGRLLGIVSEGDFIAREVGAQERRGPLWWYWASGPDKAELARVHGTTAGAAMSTNLVTIAPDRPLSEAAARMARSDVNRLPVVDGGRLVGIVTRADIVRAYARSDDELLEVLREALRAVDGMRVVAVRDGVAVLEGTVAHQSLAVTARRVAETVEGIVRVDDVGVAWVEPKPDEGWPRRDTEPLLRG